MFNIITVYSQPKLMYPDKNSKNSYQIKGLT